MDQTKGILVYGASPTESRILSEVFERLRIPANYIREEASSSSASLAEGYSCISVSHRAVLNRALLRLLKDAGVRCIITRSVGTDHIDISAADDLGIVVSASSYSPGSVADYTLMLMLLALRSAPRLLRSAKTGIWHTPSCGRELGDMTVGIVGPGNIGKAVIERLRGFGCKIKVCARTCSKETSTLSELLTDCDILTLHVPLTRETEHLIGQEEIEMMKDDAIIINTGRGALIDTPALLMALRERRLGAAALDVIEGETSGAFLNDLATTPNIIATPHEAYFTEHALFDIASSTAKRYSEVERSCKQNG